MERVQRAAAGGGRGGAAAGGPLKSTSGLPSSPPAGPRVGIFGPSPRFSFCSPMRRLAPLVAPVVLAAFALTGCRTYGAYDTDVKTHAALAEAVAGFEQALPRMEGEQAEFARFAGTDATLAPVAADYADLLAAARAMLADEKAEVAELDGSGDYRRLSHAYGATLNNHQQFADRYFGLMMRAAGTPDTTTYLKMADRSALYNTVPPFYYLTANRNRVPSLLTAARAPRPAMAPMGTSTGAPAPAATTTLADSAAAPVATPAVEPAQAPETR